MLIVALFIIAKMWKQARCPWTDEWLGNMEYIITVEYYSALRRRKF